MVKVELTLEEINILLHAVRRRASEYPYGSRFLRMKVSEEKLKCLIEERKVLSGDPANWEK